MKASLSVLAALVLVSQAHAQQYVDQYGNPVSMAPQKKAVQYDEATNTVVEVTPTNTNTTNQSVNVQQTPIVLQQAPVYQVMRPQEQPVTIVEGKHLRDSKADSMRKARTDMETDTEQKIVEKLEEARMRDEAARAEKLFGGASASASASAAASGSGAAAAASATATVVAAPAPAPAPAPVMAQPVAPPTVEVVGASASAAAAASASGTTAAAAASAAAASEARLEVKEAEPVHVRHEIRSHHHDERELVRKQDKQQLYVGALAGMAEYPDVVNMRGTGATGFSVGVVTKNRVVVEGSFQYSGFDIEDLQYGSGAFPVFRELTQYNTSAAVKFQILPGSFRPFLGGVASYTHRSYSNAQSYSSADECTTQAVDVGLTAGLDIAITDNFSVGGDFKYMTNVTSREDSRYKQSMVSPGYTYGSAVEGLEYYTLSLAGKFLF